MLSKQAGGKQERERGENFSVADQIFLLIFILCTFFNGLGCRSAPRLRGRWLVSYTRSLIQYSHSPGKYQGNCEWSWGIC